MQRLKMIVLIILILIVGIPAAIAPLHIFFILLDGDFDDWFASITETGKYTNKRIERLYSLDLRAAQTAYNVKRYDIAISYFENAINLQDTDGMLDELDEDDWLKAARTAYNVKRYNLAISCFGNVISLHNTDEILDVLDEDDFYQFVECLEKTGKIEKSI